MSEYYEGVGIFHQTSIPRTPQQNGVVERRNRTLVEAAHAPSTSHLLSSLQGHPLVFPQGVAAGPAIEDTSITQADLHPSVNPVAGELSSAQSTSGDVILYLPEKVSIPMLYGVVSIGTVQVGPKIFKLVLIEDCWFQALQDEFQDFDRLEYGILYLAQSILWLSLSCGLQKDVFVRQLKGFEDQGIILLTFIVEEGSLWAKAAHGSCRPEPCIRCVHMRIMRDVRFEKKYYREVSVLGDDWLVVIKEAKKFERLNTQRRNTLYSLDAVLIYFGMRSQLKDYGFLFNRVLCYKDGKVRSKCENKGIVPTEMELVLEYTQQGASHEVSIEMDYPVPAESMCSIHNASEHDITLVFDGNPVVQASNGLGRIHKDGDGDALFQLKSDSLPHAHAQTTKTYYKHQDSRIMKAQELKTNSQAVNKSPTHYPCDSARTFRVILFSIHNDEWKSFQCHHQTALRRPYALSWKPCQGDSLNLPDHRIHKDGDGDASFQLKSDSLPHAHAQTTKTFYKHQDSRIMKAQELKTKTSAQTLIYKIFLQRYQVYQGRLLASFQDDA
ncbi:integrase, catalytic region, zinc finger, CCHC-type containing protein [Tanacetum coccineum]